MKHLFSFATLAIVCLTLVCAQSVTAQWVRQNSANKDHINEVHFVDSLRGWAVGNYREGAPVTNTTDGGQTWRVQQINVVQHMGGVDFETPTKGWVVGNAGTILFTSNAGNTWVQQQSGVGNGFTFVRALGNGRAVVVGSGGVILRTSNNGTTWLPVDSKTTLFIDEVDFHSRGFGCAVGENGLILRTTDYGQTWEQIQTSNTYRLNAIAVMSETVACAVGFGGTILRTTDRGLTWTQQQANTTTNFRTVCFPSVDTGYAGGNGEVLITKNGGKTWDRRILTGEFVGSSFPTKGTGWITAAWGLIYKTTTGGEILTATTPASKLASCANDTIGMRVTISEGVGPYTYQWRNVNGTPIDTTILTKQLSSSDSSISIAPQASASYMAIVTDKRKLIDTVVFQSTVNPLPTVQIRSLQGGILEGLTDVPTSRADYQWYRVDSTAWTKLTFENKPELRPTESGTYGLKVTDNRTGCVGTSDVFTFIATSVDDDQSQREIAVSVYPNPSSNDVTIELTAGAIEKVVFVDALGAVVLEVNGNRQSILHARAAVLPAGVYMVVVETPYQRQCNRLLIQR
jgi:photosystem II stability/assembly factor-like uncharacterized protein